MKLNLNCENLFYLKRLFYNCRLIYILTYMCAFIDSDKHFLHNRIFRNEASLNIYERHYSRKKSNRICNIVSSAFTSLNTD